MVILGWGWVGWGGAMTFMSTCIHTSCYVIVMFSCTCTHTSCYVMVILGWGWVGWCGAMMFMSTCIHTSCYVIVMFSCTCTHTCHATLWLSWGGVGWGGVGQWGSCQLAYTRHATLLLCSLALAHTRHATLWLSWGGVGWGGVGQWCSCQLAHTRHATLLLCSLALAHTRPFFSCPLWQGRKSLTDGGKAWKIIFPKAFQDGCIMESTQKNTLNWKSLSWVTVGENLWDHWHLTDFSKNFARPSKQWSASEKKEKKCCIPKKHELMSKNEVVLEIFKTIFFTSTWEKMTFRCSENDIFVAEKLLKPYGRLWVGNRVVVCNKMSLAMLSNICFWFPWSWN